MKRLILACLLAGISFAQTRTSATQEGNNTFTGTNTFTGLVNKVCPATTVAAIATCEAALPSTGGTIDARALEGAQSITSSITIDRPTVLLLGNAVFTVSGSGEFVVTSALRVDGEIQATNTFLRGTTIIMSKAGAVFRFPTGASSQIDHFELANLQIQGGGGNFDNYVVDVPDFGAGSFDGDQARWYFHDLWIQNTGSSASTKAALNFGNSNYWISIERVIFGNNNGGDINLGYADDANITHNMFTQLSQYNPHIRIVGGSKHHIAENEFETSSSSTQPDILLQTESNNQRGFIDIIYNKFGSENENGTRSYKIRVNSASFPTALVSQVNFIGNQVTGTVGGTTACAIQTDTPISTWVVTGNAFTNISTVLCDVQSTSSTGAFGGVLRNNTISAPVGGTKCFTNGGRGFWDVDQPECSDSPRRKTTEQPELRNRLLYSQEIDNAAWTKSTGITTTTGQTDPLGGTTAVRLNNDGTTSGAFTNAVVSNSSLGNRVYVRFWAKAGTLDRLDVGYFDTNSTPVPNDGLLKLKLDSTWREYKVSFTTLNPAHTQELRLYVGEQAQQNTGNLYVWGVQVSDYDSDYVKTSGSVFSNTAIGAAFQRAIVLPTFTFAALPSSPPNGTILYCSDCTIASPTASGGTGAVVKRINGAWVGN